jgi:hypothetical protein
MLKEAKRTNSRMAGKTRILGTKLDGALSSKCGGASKAAGGGGGKIIVTTTVTRNNIKIEDMNMAKPEW